MASFLRPKKAAPGKTLLFDCPGLDLLPGEIIVARAMGAHWLLGLHVKTSLSGTLLCTNYRVSFIPDHTDKVCDLDSHYLASSRDIPVSSVSHITAFAGKGRRVIDGYSTLPKKISQLEVVCKDLRKQQYTVRQCEKTDVTSLVSAIARHSQPGNVHLLFAFDYTRALKRSHSRETTPPSGTADGAVIPSFLCARDWQRELQRLGVTNDQWRVTEVNKKFLVCSSIAPYFACPTNYSDTMLENAAGLHVNNRLPVWSWSHPVTGVSLTRAAVTSIEDPQEAPDPVYLRGIALGKHKAYRVTNKRVYQYNLTLKCGTLTQLSSGFAKLKDMCTPSGAGELGSLDRRWYSTLDSSGWLSFVRTCLLASKEIANLLCIKQRSVMLLEETGRDLSCVVSALVQLMIDPYFRSLSGFETLVQKEWVSMGHPFTTRHRLTTDFIESEDQPEAGYNINAPLLLLFLDCVWQLSKQFPSAFEFSESFLLDFHDMTMKCLHGDFIFNSPKQRLQATIYSRRSCFFGELDESMENIEANYEGPLLSAWGRWRSGLTREQSDVYLNPLYYVFGCNDPHYDLTNSPIHSPVVTNKSFDLTNAGNNGLYRGSREVSPFDLTLDSKITDYLQRGLLMPETSMCSVCVWSGYFLRYIPELNTVYRANQSLVQSLESRLVRDMRKIKDELNEVELTVGPNTSDLSTLMGEVLQSRDKETLYDKEMAVDQSLALQPRLSAVVYSYEDTDSPFSDKDTVTQSLSQDAVLDNGDLSQSSVGRPSLSQSLSQKTSLAEFTDALYSNEYEVKSPLSLYERSASSPRPTGRSPVVKTRLKVTRSKASDPVIAAWQSSSLSKTPDDKILLQPANKSFDFLHVHTTQLHSSTSLEYSDV